MPDKRLSPDVPEKLAHTQTRFAAHIRDPQHNPAPEGIEARRMAIYTELFFNSISSLLAGTFPVIHEILTEEQWQQLVRAFYRSGQAHTPYFPEIPRDFVRWLTESTNPFANKPYLPELAHYEWLELAVQIDKSPSPEWQPLPENPEALLAGAPRLSPWVRLGSYHFPVHQIKPGHEPKTPDETGHFFLVYRQQQPDEHEEVHFLSLNAVSALLFASLKDKPDQPLAHTLAAIGQHIGHQEPQALQQAGIALIQDWHRRGIVSGYQTSHPTTHPKKNTRKYP